jgi:hypothetical protein
MYGVGISAKKTTRGRGTSASLIRAIISLGRDGVKAALHRFRREIVREPLEASIP